MGVRRELPFELHCSGPRCRPEVSAVHSEQMLAVDEPTLTECVAP
jgi:hypothetical protein